MQLVALDGLEQRPEVAFAESARAAPLDHLVEERTRLCIVVQESTLHHEDLKQVTVVFTVHQHAEPA